MLSCVTYKFFRRVPTRVVLILAAAAPTWSRFVSKSDEGFGRAYVLINLLRLAVII